MKEVKVYIKDKNTLVLLENANEGDYINLSSLNKVDLSNIEEEILKCKDSVYYNIAFRIQMLLHNTMPRS